MAEKTFDFFEAALALAATRNSILAGTLTACDDRKRPIPNGAQILTDVTSEGAVVGAGILAGDVTVQYQIRDDKDELVDDSARLRHPNTLVITGSRNAKDYLYYNFRPNRSLPPMPELKELLKSDGAPDKFPERAYQRGFLLHAARVLRFLKGRTPDFIIGHSLGAASAQILGTALEVPTICFASPQVIKKRFLEGPPREKEHAQWNVFNVAWNKDFVTRGYRLTGLRALGHRVILRNDRAFNLGIDHFVTDYAKLVYMDSEKVDQKLPDKWRDPDYPVPKDVAGGLR